MSKAVERINDKTYVLPFGPKGKPPYQEYILVQPDGMIRLIGLCGAGMNIEEARQVAEALLRAVEEVEKGRK